MTNYTGIDLGTTNSAISSFDGENVRIWKSPEQNDVTPSFIYIDKRSNKYVGKRAYDSASSSPGNAASLFKRLMGTSTSVPFPAINLKKTPEECSAEVLKTLYGYLPEEIRQGKNTGTVITVPAAFNQMQKDATLQAAEIANIGQVALMQEPVAAVMSVMRTRKTDGIFIIYDLGGGTLDIAIAESMGGRVNLLSHGGIAMFGGRDWDRVLIDNVVKPWLLDNFDLPENLAVNSSYNALMRLSAWAAERAKIELSSKEEAIVNLSETEARTKDKSDKEIYLDIILKREILDSLIEERVNESINAVRETLEKSGLTPNDIERIVFVGGPTNYKPLRDKVAAQLAIKANTDVNPMTAVSEGAALFAESIDWSSRNRSRKNTRGKIAAAGKLDVVFKYISRTPETKAKIVVQAKGKVADGAEFQIDSVETGWTSGRLPLGDSTTVDVILSKNGDNAFKIFAFDDAGNSLPLEQDRIIITRTAATVDAIPASHSIGIEVLEKLGGRPTLDWLIRVGDRLPQKGERIFKTIEAIKAGSPKSIKFKIWEGEIEEPVTDNRFIGVLQVSGNDFDEGVIPAGADLHCNFEILDSGNIVLEVEIPSIRSTFRRHNFYSRQEGQVDFSNATAQVNEAGEHAMQRLDEISKVVEDPKLEQARQKLSRAVRIDRNDSDAEETQEAMEEVLEAKRILANVRKEHLKAIRQLDLDAVEKFFENNVRKHARPSEETAFDNLVRTAQREIDRDGKEFENHLDNLRGKNFGVLWRQDWFVIETFKHMANMPYKFSDQHEFQKLIKEGLQFLQAENIDELREVLRQLYAQQINSGSEDQMLDMTNITRG